MAKAPLQINGALPATALTAHARRVDWRCFMSGHPCRARQRLHQALGGAIAALALLQPQSAAAQTSYAFNSTAVDAFGAGPYGSVSLAQSFSDVLVSVSLRSDLNFVNTGSHAIFTFNLAGSSGSNRVTDISFANGLSNVFGIISAPDNSPFSTFSYGITCVDHCTNGGSGGGYADPLTFTVHNAVLSDFEQLSSGKGRAAYFAADVINGTGTTGTMGATSVTAVPEPASYAMLLAGFGLIGSIIKHRRRNKLSS